MANLSTKMLCTLLYKLATAHDNDDREELNKLLDFVSTHYDVFCSEFGFHPDLLPDDDDLTKDTITLFTQMATNAMKIGLID